MTFRDIKISYLDDQGLEKSITLKTGIADTAFLRLKGLMGSASLPSGEALLLSPCNCIHTFFMNYSIDALFLDSNYNYIRMVQDIRPRKFGIGCKKAKYVLELASGSQLNEMMKIISVGFFNSR